MNINNQFNQILESNPQYKESLRPPRVRDIIEGRIIEITKKGIYLELLSNYKIGIIKRSDLGIDSEKLKRMKKGDKIMAKVINLENKEGLVELSLKKAEEDLKWQQLKNLLENKEKISLKVTNANQGGLILDFFDIECFLPASRLSIEHYPKIERATPERISEELKKFIGQQLDVRVIKIEPQKRIILSER